MIAIGVVMIIFGVIELILPDALFTNGYLILSMGLIFIIVGSIFMSWRIRNQHREKKKP
jgi:uncharacterized membrane protein HdeD (DUF308 family)